MKIESIITFLLFSVLGVFCLTKVLFVNQIFPIQESKRILSFSNVPRIFRVLKLVAGAACINLFHFNDFLIIFGFVNTLELIINF